MKASLERDVLEIKREIFRLTPPPHFSLKDIARSFFGALFLASTFIFSSQLVHQTTLLTTAHVVAIILATLGVLTVEIFFIGYERVPDRRQRRFMQFWAKRIVTFYAVAWFVSFGLAWLYGFDKVFPTVAELLKFAVVLSFPASVGAALGDLLRSY